MLVEILKSFVQGKDMVRLKEGRRRTVNARSFFLAAGHLAMPGNRHTRRPPGHPQRIMDIFILSDEP